MSPEEFMEAVEHICRVTLLNIEPGAIVLLELDHQATAEDLDRIGEQAKRLFDPHKVAILAGGVKVSGLRIEAPEPDNRMEVIGEAADFEPLVAWDPAQFCTSELLTESERATLHEFLRAQQSGSTGDQT